MSTFTEQVTDFLESARVSGSVVRGVAVLRSTSLNGRRYSSQALADVADLAEDARVFIDHDKKRVRSMRDLAGFLRAPRVKDGTVTANLHLVESPFKDMVLSVAEEVPDAPIGLSIVGSGEAKTEDGVQVVERVDALKSVDLVSAPASTRSLFESVGFRTRRRKPRKPQPLTDEKVEEAWHEMFV